MSDPAPATSDAALEASVVAALDRESARYEVLDCDPAFADTAAFCARYGIDPGDSANAILVATRREPKVHALCLVLATTRLDVNHAVADLMGVKKLSFASGEETAQLTGMVLGGVTPFAIPQSLPLYVDARVVRRVAGWDALQGLAVVVDRAERLRELRRFDNGPELVGLVGHPITEPLQP